MKVAIIHDFLNQYGGAEKVVEVLHEIFPEAPIYTSFYVPAHMTDQFRKMPITTSFMNRLPWLKKHFKKYLLLYPFAFQSFDLSGYDVILSSSSSFAKGVRKPKGAVHICYCYTPPRFIWRSRQYLANENMPLVIKKAVEMLVRFMRNWDLRSSTGVDHFVAISGAIQRRIKDIYKRDSTVIYPPVETQKFALSQTAGKFYLIVSRLNAYKRLDIVIDAFNTLGFPLKIIGEGAHAPMLKKMAGPSVEFLGRCSNEQVVANVAGCRALLWPGEEDFGIAPVEAQAVGRPVVAFAAAGALETVVDGVTGVFFHEQTAKSVVDSVLKLEKKIGSFDSAAIRENALRFDKSIFKERLKRFVEEKYAEHAARNAAPEPIGGIQTLWIAGFMAAMGMLGLFLGVPLGLHALVILSLFAIAGFVSAYLDRTQSAAFLLAMLPVSGMVINSFSLKAVSPLIPYALFAMAGFLLSHSRLGFKTVKLDIPRPILVFAASVVVSTFAGLGYFASFLPDLSAVVSHAPWGHVKLINAVGWVMLAVLNILVGFSVFVVARIEFSNPFKKFFYLKYLFAGCFASFLVGLLQFVQLPVIGKLGLAASGNGDRFNAGFTHPNSAGLFSIGVFFLWIGVVLTAPKQKRLYILGPCLIFLAIISGSRSAFILLGVGLVLYALVTRRQWRASLPLLLLMVVWIGSALLIVKLRLPESRSYKLVKDVGTVSTQSISTIKNLVVESAPLPVANSGVIPQSKLAIAREQFDQKLNVFLYNRTPYWKNAWQTFMHHPIVGCGVGTYLVRAPEYATTLELDGNPNAMNDNACNMYLQIAAEQGVIGLLAFLGVLAGIGRWFWRGARTELTLLDFAALSGLAGMAVSFLVGAHLVNFEINLLFWLMLSFFYPLKTTFSREDSSVEN